MAKRKVKKREDFHSKIKVKEAQIKKSRDGEKLELTDELIKDTMIKYGIEDYEIKVWGDVTLKSKYDKWKISTDEDDEVIYLHHENEKLARKGNSRSAYHIHNVFYDLDYCVNTIIEHDNYREVDLKNKEDT